jgi:pimeloyl-ACP methyl ester carboxylesterase
MQPIGDRDAREDPERTDPGGRSVMDGDFVICARSVRGGRFTSEPGSTQFLRVPPKDLPSPDQKVKPGDWIKAVIDEATLTPAADGDPARGDLLVFIHGYNNTQDVVMERHRMLREGLERLGFQGAVATFDWPSADSALNYLEDRSDAKATALRLVDDCIARFAAAQQPDCRINVHLLAHSTGAYVVREAFDDADDRPGIAARNWMVSQIAFIGGDVSSGSMSEGNAATESLMRHCIRLTNYSNPFDSVLKLSNVKRLGAAPRVGRVGLPGDAPPQCVDVDCGPYFSTLDEKKADFVGTFCHSWHIGDPLFTQDLLSTLQGDLDRNVIPTRKREDGKLTLSKP